jgi:hypothetical protein
MTRREELHVAECTRTGAGFRDHVSAETR